MLSLLVVVLVLPIIVTIMMIMMITMIMMMIIIALLSARPNVVPRGPRQCRHAVDSACGHFVKAKSGEIGPALGRVELSKSIF